MDNNNEIKKSYLDHKQNLITRLNKIEGQIRGIKKMLEEERECTKVLEQMSSVRASIDAVGLMIVGCALHTEIKKQIETGQPKATIVTETMKPFLKRFFE